ncbi:hypothetical protein ACW2QC_16365 [Virgibacillus sp. FSP13]
MVRSFITLLLLAVCFLTGMLLGIDRGQDDNAHQEEEIKEVIVSDKDVEQDTNDTIEIESETPTNIDSPASFTQKMASFLEVGIKGFYEMVVMIVYQIAQLFV